jgi:DNA transposition AAA+ family ATPase
MIRDLAAIQPETTASAACQTAVRQYLDATGIHVADFARRIGYGRSTVASFLAGRYETIGGDTGKVLAAAERFMAAHPVRPSRPLHGELFETDNVRLIQETFADLLMRPYAYVIYAPPGSQKSFVLEHEVFALNRRELAKNADGARAYYIYCSQSITQHSILNRIAKACGLRIGDRKTISSTGSEKRIAAAAVCWYSTKRST